MMLIRKAWFAINLITDRVSYATLFSNLARRKRLSGLLTSIFFVHCFSPVVLGQANLNPPTEILAPPVIKQEPSTASNQDSLILKQDNQEPADEDPRQAMMSGPMHEAFLEVHEADPKPNAIVKRSPPEPINEVPPEYKPEGENVQWIPGYWGWDFEKEDFVWVSGLWRDIPPDRKWIPGYWQDMEEGFRWISGYWQLESDEDIDYLPEPPTNIDSGPSTPAPSENHFYVPGSWVMNNSTYQWSPGYWQANVVDWVWVPTRYVWTPYGCIYRPGYWDRVLSRRGVVFAPVYYSTPYYRTIGYRYTPRYSINVGVRLLPHLFVNLRYGHFYYGDWYSSSFSRHGICSWVNVRRHHRRYYDPLLSYYSSPACRYNNRNSFLWARDHHYHVLKNPHLRPCRSFARPVRRSGVGGAVHVRNGTVNIGVRYTELVRNSRRPVSGVTQVKIKTDRPHYHREFRQLSKTDLLRERQRTKPINEVRVARRTHEVHAKRPSPIPNRQRTGSRGKKLSVEKYAKAARKPNAPNQGKNNATRFAGKKRPSLEKPARPTGSANRGSLAKSANSPSKNSGSIRRPKSKSSATPAKNRIGSNSARPAKSSPSKPAVAKRPLGSNGIASSPRKGKSSGTKKKSIASTGKSISRKPTRSNPTKEKPAIAGQPSPKPKGKKQTVVKSRNPTTRVPGRLQFNSGRKGSAAPSRPNSIRPDSKTNPKSPNSAIRGLSKSKSSPRPSRPLPSNAKPSISKTSRSKPTTSKPTLAKSLPKPAVRNSTSRSSVSPRPSISRPQPKRSPSQPTNKSISKSTELTRRQQIEQTRKMAIERSKRIQADRARQRQLSLEKQRAESARKQQAALARRKQIEADAQRRAEARRAATAKAIQDSRRRAEEARRQATLRRSKSSSPKPPTRQSVRPTLPKPKPHATALKSHGFSRRPRQGRTSGPKVVTNRTSKIRICGMA